MTLARTALRFAAIAALKGATIAEGRVYDSRVDDFSPETFPGDAHPTIIILTDEDEGEALSAQNGGPPMRRTVSLVMEFAMVQGLYLPVGDSDNGDSEFVPGYPATDAEHEVSLDLLEFQIKQRLADDLSALPRLFRSFTRVWKSDCHRQVADDSGVKIAARILTWECETSDDDIAIYRPDQPEPTGFDILPEPLRRVAKALPDGNEKNLCLRLVTKLSPLPAEPLEGMDITVQNAEGVEAPSNQISVTLDLPQP